MAFCLHVLLCKHNKETTNVLAKCLLSTLKRPLKWANIRPRPIIAIDLGLPKAWPIAISSKLLLNLTRPTKFHCRCHKYSSQTTFTCWKCGETIEKNSLFCKKCNVLQKPDLKMNYFDVIGVEKKYEIKVNELTTKYRKLQGILHPDRFSNRDKEEIKISEDFSSLVNKAYATLLHPLSRGLYMLKLKGIFIEEGRVQSSPEFLMKMMEKNEEIDEAQDAEQIKILHARNKASLEELSKKVGEALNCGDIKCAEEVLIEMKYYASIDLKIKDLKQKKGFAD